jgi:hypothetical protein
MTSAAYPAHRLALIALGGCTTVSTLAHTSLSPAQILNTLCGLEPEVPLLLKDISNLIQKARLEELDRRTLIQWILEVIALPCPALPCFYSTYTNLYRSFKVVILLPNIGQKVDLLSDLLLYIQPPLYFGSKILISCSLIVPIRLIGTKCYS